MWVLQLPYSSALNLCGDYHEIGCCEVTKSIFCSSAGKITYIFFRRACVVQDDCDFKGNRDLYGQTYRVATTCCSTDGCTPPVPTLLPSSDEPNGLTCPSCVPNNVTKCNSSETVTCTGNETVCFFLEMKGTTGEVTNMWGCATQSYCVHVANEDIKILHATGIAQTNYICFRGLISVQNYIQTPAIISTRPSGGISVQKVVLTPAVVCLLLLTWLF
ncbi:phospholipase A2 inhibitor subunit gamma B-like [Bufo bufo]|uniref:phospholipase A2 inhibitor subunit gamma B-like n=1 Tax=Bufo bufo TaxID=8384 RepID=UPI001ABE09AD|nr:phospholipase A2 inhibitor subunit gamma B-like [Bufo bufo]